MSWVAVAVGVGTAAVGAYSSSQSAKAANKPKKGYTDQTTTQTPYLEDTLAPHLQTILGGQANLYGAGQPTASSAAPSGVQFNNPNAVYVRPNGEEHWQGKNQGKPRPTGPVVDARTGKAISGAPPAAGGAASPAASTTPTYSSPDEIYREVANRNLARTPSPLLHSARSKTTDIINSQGFDSYNPILQDLQGRLGGASLDRSSGLLEQFLGENQRGSSGTSSGSTSPQLTSGGYPSGGSSSSYSRSSAPAAVGGGGVVPDASGSGLFGQEVQKIFDDEMAREELDAYMAAITEDSLEGHFAQLADLDARAMGAGRYGGGDAAYERLRAREEFDEGIQGAGAKLAYDDLLSRRNAKLGALGQVNARDLGAMSDATSRASIGAASADSAASRALQEKLGLRSQDLQAIGMMMGNDQFGLGLLGELGGQRSSDLFTGLGLAPGLEYADLAPEEMALAAGQGLSGLELGRGQIQASKAGTNLQRRMYEESLPQQQLNDYLRTVLSIGGLGGSAHTAGTNVQPGLGVSTSGAALMGALGGAATGYGAYNAYRGG